MGDVLVTFRIMPESPDTEVEGLLGAFDFGDARLQGVEKEPIAFGLVALKAAFIVRDEGGAAEEVEEALRGIEGVKGVETVSMTLV